jgi:hypothetical protein
MTKTFKTLSKQNLKEIGFRATVPLLGALKFQRINERDISFPDWCCQFNTNNLHPSALMSQHIY